MSLTADEVTVCNQSLDRIGSKNFTLAVQTDVKGLKCNTIFSQTRDAVLRSFEWPFAKTRDELDIVQTLTLDASPSPDAWSADTTITGISSYATATVISATNDVEYEISYISDDFTDGETLTDGDVEVVYWEGIPLEYGDETVLWYNESSSNNVVCGTGYPTTAVSTPDFEWDYKYTLPTDFLRLVMDYTTGNIANIGDRFTIEGEYLLTNYDEAEIVYIKKVTDPADFDPLFTEVLILTLAKKLIPALAGTKNPGLVEEVTRDLSIATAKARAVCRAETNVSGRSSWNLARFGSGKV